MRARELIAVCASLCLLGGAAVESASISAPSDASAYLAGCRKVAGTISTTAGDWVGRDVHVPAEVIAHLRPNAVVSRRFVNTISGYHASSFFAQCSDARDLLAHYPPVCYPNSRGMQQVSAEKRKWTAGDLAIHGTEYVFRSADFGSGSAAIVLHFIMMPDGRICEDIGPVREEIQLRERYYGAAQFELVFDATVPAASRDAAMVELVSGYRPLIDAVLGGRKKS